MSLQSNQNRPDFPKRFGCYEDAQAFCRAFFDWYNNEHYHSGIGLLTPSSLHYGQAQKIINARKETLQQAWQQYPERFINGVPKPAALPTAVWINPPQRTQQDKTEAPQANCPGAPERYVFDAPSIWLSLGWLRPRRANFRFTRPTEHTTQNSFEHPSHA